MLDKLTEQDILSRVVQETKQKELYFQTLDKLVCHSVHFCLYQQSNWEIVIVSSHEAFLLRSCQMYSAFSGNNHFNGNCCYVVVDRFALESCDFGTAVTALFAAYYVFNVSYPQSSTNTLEFVQR